MSIRTASSVNHVERSALIAGIAAFTTWGLVPVYWKLLKTVPATEILAHRFVWTTVFLILLLSWQRRWSEVLERSEERRVGKECRSRWSREQYRKIMENRSSSEVM